MLTARTSGELATLAVAYIGGGYALGTWLGKLFGLVANRDRSFYGDICGVIGGLWGMLVFAVTLSGKLNS